MKLIYLMGGTCSGKSTFVKHAKEYYGSRAGFVEVGQMLRKKYPPEHFQGLGAPDHMDQEAIQMYMDEVERCMDDVRVNYIFVDGQPRCSSQVKAMLTSFSSTKKVFLLFEAPADVQAERAAKRFAKDPAGLELAIKRIDNDRKQGYDTLVELLKRAPVHVIPNLGVPDDTFDYILKESSILRF